MSNEFCLLCEPLPAVWEGQEIDPDFRIMVWMENGLFRVEAGNEAAFAWQALSRFYKGHVPAEPVEAWEAMIRFYGGLEDMQQVKPAAGGRRPPRAYDFSIDGGRIAAAFRQAYGIDLTDPALRLHWWLFRALLANLPGECAFCKIVDYRTADLSELPKSLRQQYTRLRKKYALPAAVGGQKHYASLEEREAAFLAR